MACGWKRVNGAPPRGRDAMVSAMSDESQPQPKPDAVAEGGSGGKPERHGPPPTPFDHPLFLPALLVAGMLWFGYDGWINQDPDMLEHQEFNRYGFGVLTIAAAWFGWKGWREWQEERAARDESAAG